MHSLGIFEFFHFALCFLLVARLPLLQFSIGTRQLLLDVRFAILSFLQLLLKRVKIGLQVAKFIKCIRFALKLYKFLFTAFHYIMAGITANTKGN